MRVFQCFWHIKNIPIRKNYFWNLFIQCIRFRWEKLNQSVSDAKCFLVSLFSNYSRLNIIILKYLLLTSNIITLKNKPFWRCWYKVKFRSFLYHLVCLIRYLKLQVEAKYHTKDISQKPQFVVLSQWHRSIYCIWWRKNRKQSKIH